MDERSPGNVIAFPAHRRGTIEDTLSGFADRAGHGEWFGRRAERWVTVFFAELRGWHTITDRVGPEQAEEVLARVVNRALESLSETGAVDVTLGGEPMQPVISARFEGEGHAVAALRAALAVRHAAATAQFPALPGHQYQVCTGVNSGTIVDAHIGAESTMAFQSVGTVETFAMRLQEFAGPGQIFLSEETCREAGGALRARSIGEVRVNAAGELREAYLLTDVAAAEVPAGHGPPVPARPGDERSGPAPRAGYPPS
ncbi:MAG: hypothetical protein HY658_09245 [Actinobacteria bacterium]|nr:hypothetical protein [Actinomycetota bacterium]